MGVIRSWWGGEGPPPSRRAVQCLLACAWLLIGSLLIVSDLLTPQVDTDRSDLWVMGALVLGVAAAIATLPWCRWKRSAPLWLVPVIFGTLAVNYGLGGHTGFGYPMGFLVVFVFIGATQPPRTALRFTPLLALEYLAPIIVVGGAQAGAGVAAAVYVVPMCVLAGEVVARALVRIRRTEAQLAESNLRYMMAFEAAPVGMTQVSPDGVLLHVNGAFARMMGYEVKELVGRSVVDITHPDDRAPISGDFAAWTEDGSSEITVEKRNIRADGSDLWVLQSASLVRDDAGQPLYFFGHMVDISEERSLRDQLAYAAEHDQLTGLPNRTTFMSHLERSIARAEHAGHHVALMFLDIDRFKFINDGLGHDVGDRLLKEVAQRLRDALRPQDVVARFGGDEFVVCCEVSSGEEALDIARRLEAAMTSPLPSPNNDLLITLSIGIALSDPTPTDADVLVRRADTSMYKAKGWGQGRIALYEPGDVLHSERKLQTTNELRAGLVGGEFSLCYQPIVELANGQMVGVQAEIRWQHPTQGLLLPSEFMPVADEGGLGGSLGSWALRELCRQGAVWLAERTRGDQREDRLNLVLNVGIQALVAPEFAGDLAELLSTTGVPAERLWLEITEGAILASLRSAGPTVHRIRALGVHFAIKAFGTERSSLNYLRELPVEMVSFDQAYIDHIEEGAIDEAMLEAMLALTASLGLTVVAEGIQRQSQAHRLCLLGCTLGQGPLFGSPLSAVDMSVYPSDDLSPWRDTVRALVIGGAS